VVVKYVRELKRCLQDVTASWFESSKENGNHELQQSKTRRENINRQIMEKLTEYCSKLYKNKDDNNTVEEL